MKQRRASGTALLVTNLRALADAGVSHVRDFHDPTARAFLDPKSLRRLANLERQARNGGRGVALAFARAGADLVALRTEAIDAAIRAAVARGTRQVVILGAGFDGRAWRMRELASARVFEVDHPATQAVKRAHVNALGPPAAHVSFVAVDFEHEALDAALAREGHDAAMPTCWIWEGVVMYLTRDAMRSTLANLASRSASGSTLIVNYHTHVRRRWVSLILRLVGEPNRTAWSPAEMTADLGAAGFDVSDDSGIVDWARRFAPDAQTRAGRETRIAVATI